MTLDLGTIVGAPVLGQIAESFGFPWMFVAIGGVSFLAAVAFALVQCL